MDERGRFKDVEQHVDIDVADRARQSLAFRRTAARLLISRPPTLKDAFDSVAPDQNAMVAGTGRQLDRPGAKLGILLVPALEIEIDARAGALDHGLEGVVLERPASCHHSFGGLEAGAAICIEAERVEGHQSIDLLLDLVRLLGAGDNVPEVASRSEKIA